MYKSSGEPLSGQRKIIACRVCLGTTGKMYCIESCGLGQSFLDVTGIQVFVGDGLPQHICYICCGLLQKAVQFRNKCHSTKSLLSTLPLTLDLIQQINMLHGDPLTRTNVVYVDIVDDVKDKELITEFIDTGLENNPNEINESIDTGLENNPNGEELENKFNDKDTKDEFNGINENDADPTINNNSIDHDDPSDVDNDEWLSYNLSELKGLRRNKLNHEKCDIDAINYRISAPHPSEQLVFYKYIDARYIKKTWRNGKLNDDESPDDLTVTVNKNNKEITYNFDPKVNKFYDYLKQRYGYVDEDREETGMECFGKNVVNTKPLERSLSNAQLRRRAQALEYEKKYNFVTRRLSKAEQIKDLEKRKERNRYKNSVFQCTDCYMGFRDEQKYKKHRMMHDPAISGKYECEICKLKFQRKISHSYHTRKSHTVVFVCKECGYRVRDRPSCMEHYRSHTNEDSAYKCKHCPATFRTTNRYYKHIRAKHGTTNCDICYTTLTPGGVARHVMSQHREVAQCEICKKIFNEDAALKRHLDTSPNGVCSADSWPCARCGEYFSTEDDLTRHIEASRRRPLSSCINNGNPPIKRKRKRPSSTRFMCEVCARAEPIFSHKGGLATSVEQRPSKSMSQLKEHMRIHTGEKPFQCSVCDKSFRVKSLLQVHMRSHTGERPHKCLECPKAFTMLANLLRHQLVHLKLHPYACEICSKPFRTASNVKKHIHTVHMRMPQHRNETGTPRKRKSIQLVPEQMIDSVTENVNGNETCEEEINTQRDDFEDDTMDVIEDERNGDDEDNYGGDVDVGGFDVIEEVCNEDEDGGDEDVDGSVEDFEEGEVEYLDNWQDFEEEIVVEYLDD